MYIDNSVVGRKIESIRVNLGMTMEEFGKMFNTSKGTVNNWEKGRNRPNKNNMKKIADLGNTTVDELIYGTKEEFLMRTIKNKISDDINFWNKNGVDERVAYLEKHETEIVQNIRNLIIDYLPDMSYQKIEEQIEQYVSDISAADIIDTSSLKITLSHNFRHLIHDIKVKAGIEKAIFSYESDSLDKEKAEKVIKILEETLDKIEKI